jgi:uncharacterized membrane protein YhiD involved in acid resistance
MELLPIIYWSLIGVGVLAVVVIIFSYVTFNVRKKLGNIPSEEVKGEARNKKVTITNPDKKESSKKAHHPKVQTRSRQKENTQKKKNVRTTASKEKDSQLYKRPTKDSKRKRIEIINAPETSSKSDVNFHSMNATPKRKGWN